MIDIHLVIWIPYYNRNVHQMSFIYFQRGYAYLDKVLNCCHQSLNASVDTPISYILFHIPHE